MISVLHEMESEYIESPYAQLEIARGYVKVGHEFEQYLKFRKAQDNFSAANRIALRLKSSALIKELSHGHLGYVLETSASRAFSCEQRAKTVTDVSFPETLKVDPLAKCRLWRDAAKAFVVRAEFLNANHCILKMRDNLAGNADCWYTTAQTYGFFSRLSMGFDFSKMEPGQIAIVVKMIRNAEAQALEFLEKAIELGFQDSKRLGTDPHFHGLYGTTRFTNMLSELQASVSEKR
ncbi:MAG: hypothetical protein AAFX06_19460 [Planctomycetota bacterium]